MSPFRPRPLDISDSPTIDVVREEHGVIVHVPVKFYRRNGRQTIMTENDDANTHQAVHGKNHALIANIAKALQWQEQLESGEYETVEDLAKANGVDRTYVGRTIQLTSLSPKTVERILDGLEPSGISLRQLRKGVRIIWSNQV